ncbi:hypothetical protein BG015_009228 [Linnemannia schmuckeri]|uniref:Uncharacterized protein n=1 Tax=Linnemannia schmuckeri TaxID=64567 RepID=A0A9P5V9H6_9FUNG|nr:hypothetical protein BG015_009228 [Linnemannia schmuckeri]
MSRSKMKGIAFNDATMWVDSPAIPQEKHGYAVHMYSCHGADTNKVKVQIANDSAEAQKCALYPFLEDIDSGVIQPGTAFSIEEFYGHRSSPELEVNSWSTPTFHPCKLVMVESRTANFGTVSVEVFHVFLCDARTNASLIT